MVFSKWYVLAHDKFKRNKIKSAVKWLWVMALMKWQQNKQKCVTWYSWKAKANWVHLLDSISTKIYYNMCKQQTECHWCGQGMSLTLLRSGCQESPELCCVPMGYFWGCNQSIFWPQPCNRKHVTSCTLRPPAAALHWRRTNVQNRTRNLISANRWPPVEKACLKKGRNMWAIAELMDWESRFTSFPGKSPSGWMLSAL